VAHLKLTQLQRQQQQHEHQQQQHRQQQHLGQQQQQQQQQVGQSGQGSHAMRHREVHPPVNALQAVRVDPSSSADHVGH
jgi:hypothetical protein